MNSTFCTPTESQIKEMKKALIDVIHVEIMDGRFVPGFTFGADFVRQLRNFTDIALNLFNE